MFPDVVCPWTGNRWWRAPQKWFAPAGTNGRLRPVLRRMTPEEGMKWTERLVDFFFPLHRAVRASRIGHALVSRVSPVLTYLHCYPLTDELHRQWALLDTHDALTDWYKHKRTKGQIRRVLEQLGGVDISCEYRGNGVEARCRRP